MNNITEKTATFVYRYAFICFLCGLCADTIAYLTSRNYPATLLNMLAIVLIGIVFCYHFQKRMSGQTALIYLLCVMQCNIVGTMISHALRPVEYQAYGLLMDLVTALVVCVLATILQRRSIVIGMCLAAVAPFALIAILYPEQPMLWSLPSLCAIFMMPIGMTSRMMQRAIQQLDTFLNEQLVLEAQKRMLTDRVLIAAMERRHINLTKHELELCHLILESKTIEEIGIAHRLSPAAVRTRRSRLRKKLGMNSEEDMKVHLLSIIEQKDME